MVNDMKRWILAAGVTVSVMAGTYFGYRYFAESANGPEHETAAMVSETATAMVLNGDQPISTELELKQLELAASQLEAKLKVLSREGVEVLDMDAFTARYDALGERVALMADPDHLTVATECATARVGLLQFQMESMPNDLLIAMNSVGNGLGEAIGEAVGFSAANPGRSCKDIKERYDDAVDGSYWINVSNNQPGDSMEVFCDMTTDGGGWTLAAYLGSGGSRIPNGFWVEPVSAEHYDINRSPIATDYSLGILDEMDDTEMVIVGNTPDIASADGLNGLIQFRYPVSSPTFNNALLPHLDSLFEMRRKLDSDYQQGKLLSTSRTHFWMVQNTQSQSQFYISVNGNSGYYYSPGYRATQLWFYVR